jgi:hypothetical protein
MRRALLILTASALWAFALAPAAQAALTLEGLDVTFTDKAGNAELRAGAHPHEMTTSLAVKTVTGEAGEVPEEEVRNLTVSQIPGFVGSQTTVPTCSAAEFNQREEGRPACTDATAVGYAATELEFNVIAPEQRENYVHSPVYNLAPPPGAAARLGFIALNVPVVIDVTVSDKPPYNLVARVREIPQAVLFYSSRLTLWGVPADESHDSLRGDCIGEVLVVTKDPVSLGQCPVQIQKRAFLTMPRACEGPLATVFDAVSWKGSPFSGQALTHDDGDPPNPRGMGECASLPFAADAAAAPTTATAESASGLEFGIEVEDPGLTSPTGRAQSDIRKVVVRLPEGMTANPSSAEGLEVCSAAALARETLASLPGQGCPDASKLGAIEVRTPLLDRPLGGSLYLAEPYRNPFGTLLALHMVIKAPELGIIIKQPVKVEPDPRTGQLVSTATELPQLPFSSFTLRFREGARSPLVTPPACGSHAVITELTPWSGAAPLTDASSFQILAGAGGGPCPQGGAPFRPGFEAGTLNNRAGAYSPTQMRLTRTDGDQDLTKFSAVLPRGLVAKLAGTTRCPDAAIAAARTRTAAAEKAAPSCPASSRLGGVLAGAGVGAVLTYVPGSIYLAGPLNGAPLSVAAIVPAQAGPFDVGTVVTRVALRIDPRSAEVTVDGSASDPIPHILAGIPLKVRDIRVSVDRPDFTLNPTSCEPFAFAASLWGGGADPFSVADDSPVSLADRFQAADCASLGFRPRVGLKLTGATKRGGHPGLIGTYRPRAGDANLAGLTVRLPRSAFLEQAHIRTICTRVQFAADNCPKGAVYGTAVAHTPLLEEPLTGPVYLRSSDNKLPDMVASLHGLIDVEAVARIDSVRGGIRATFTGVPDAPITKVVVRMQGQKKGLIVNSTNLCAAKGRARISALAHNAMRSVTGPRVVAAGCGKGRRGRKG